MSESIDGSNQASQVGKSIVSNYNSPLFLGNDWGFHCENWDRSSIAVAEYRNRRDGRMTYDWSSSQVLDYFKKNYSESGIANWAGHGNDPYFYQLSTRITSYNVCYTKLLRILKKPEPTY